MSLREAWTLVSGQDDLPVVVGPLVAYSLAFVACLLLQRACRPLLPPGLYSYAADFIFTMAICSYPYSHGQVRSLYGHVGYIVARVTLVTASLRTFDGSPSPLGVLARYLKGAESLPRLGARTLVQILGAVAAYRLVCAIWSLEVTEEHELLLKKTTCESALRVPAMTGFFVESSAVAFNTWLTSHRLASSSLVDMVVKNTNGALLTCAGFRLTGLFMHPALASGMTFNCEGTDPLAHVFVYWVGSFLGVFVGQHLYSVFRLPFLSSSDAASGVPAKTTDAPVKKMERDSKKTHGRVKKTNKKSQESQGRPMAARRRLNKAT